MVQDNRPEQPRSGRHRKVSVAVKLAVFGMVIATSGAFLAQVHWTLDLLSHFRLQYVVGSLLIGMAAFVLRLHSSALLTVVVAIINLMVIAPYLMPGGKPAQASVDTIRILTANVSARNTDYQALRDLIADAQPQVIGLQETDQAWADALHTVSADYPYRILRPEDGAYGLLLLSRIPLLETAASPYREDGVQTAVMAEMKFADSRVMVVLVHLMAPTLASRSALRNRQLEVLAGYFRESRGMEGILLGDLNTTPWSPFYAVLEKDTGLLNAARGNGYLATWPTWLSFLRIPIDHCLVSEGLRVTQVRTGPDIGSDHLPLIVDIAITTKSHRVHSAE